MGNVDYKATAGAVSVEIHCDTTELDAALEKMDRLVQLADKAQAAGILPAGMLAVMVGAAASPERFSRRRLLAFWEGIFKG